MAIRFTIRTLVPSISIFAALIAGAIACDYLLHLAGLVWIGRYLGIVGTLLIVASFVYSLRKRRIVGFGTPRRLLQWHQSLGWAGALLVVVHGGIHFNAVLPWLALVATLVVVASGLTGRYLLISARESLRGRAAELEASGRAPAEVDQELLVHSLLVDTMGQWRRVHMPLTMVMIALVSVHIVAILALWRW